MKCKHVGVAAMFAVVLHGASVAPVAQTASARKRGGTIADVVGNAEDHQGRRAPNEVAG